MIADKGTMPRRLHIAVAIGCALFALSGCASSTDEYGNPINGTPLGTSTAKASNLVPSGNEGITADYEQQLRTLCSQTLAAGEGAHLVVRTDDAGGHVLVGTDPKGNPLPIATLTIPGPATTHACDLLWEDLTKGTPPKETNT